MGKEKLSTETLEQNKDIFIPNVSVDCTIFGFHSGCLKILLCKFKVSDKWMIPGGFISKDELPDEAASRVLIARTGLNDIYLKQFYFLGKKPNNEDIIDKTSSLNSSISLAYYALIKFEEAKIQANEYENIGWFDINEIPDLYPAHREIVNVAIETIRKQIGFVPIGYELLPEKFTMPELRSIYESILGRELDRRNFQRKMLSIGYIKALNETRKAGAHKSPNLYTFDKERYKEAEQLGIQIMSNNL